MAALKVLLTGSTGLLGLSLLGGKPPEADLYADCYNFPRERFPKLEIKKLISFDIRKNNEVAAIFKEIKPDAVIHAASIGNVDYCENNKEAAWQTNVEGSRNIIRAAKEYGAFIVFTSSNAVFDGKHAPYSEGDKPNPVDYYGNTKLQTETDLAASGARFAVARLMTMYGWNHPLERQNPVTWALEKLAKKEKINVVNDIYNNHLFVESAAQAIWAAVINKSDGVYHLAGSEIISRYEFARRAAGIFGMDTGLIKAVDSSFFPSIAPRPKNTSYKIEKMEKTLGVKGVGIDAGLRLMKKNPPAQWQYEWYKKSGPGF